MAVTHGPKTIQMTAAADAVVGSFTIQSIELDHTAASNAVLTDGASKPLAVIRTGANLFQQVVFKVPIQTEGIIAPTLAGGTLLIHLA